MKRNQYRIEYLPRYELYKVQVKYPFFLSRWETAGSEFQTFSSYAKAKEYLEDRMSSDERYAEWEEAAELRVKNNKRPIYIYPPLPDKHEEIVK